MILLILLFNMLQLDLKLSTSHRFFLKFELLELLFGSHLLYHSPEYPCLSSLFIINFRMVSFALLRVLAIDICRHSLVNVLGLSSFEIIIITQAELYVFAFFFCCPVVFCVVSRTFLGYLV